MRLRITIAAVLLVVALVASLHLGLRTYGPLVVWQGLSGGTGADAVIVQSLRLPRSVIAALAGGALALAGFLMQTVSRNALAEPGLLGINAGAALAVVIGASFAGVVNMAGIAALALAGALAPAFLVFAIANRQGNGRPVIMLLAGVTIAAMLSSFTQVLLLINETALETLLFWLSGGFADRHLSLAWIGGPSLLIGLVVTLSLSSTLEALKLDDASAASIGLPVVKAKLACLALAASLAASAVAMAGPVVFLGLVAPHLARSLATARVSMVQLIVFTLLTGSVIALLADILARFIAAPGEAPIGVVLAFVGAPMLIFLLRKTSEGRR
ncbi:iron ABC transporter permease (plasmid) [Peteryoungia desertarenae]|uniref:Iron ABC transporter permease n=1 Tax=Peteryoungia desertarenae TaxID=1813451 RepID=A0ABX6QT24_9HYPH|nr:iron ABC transporter permease [Peteryoungia desertarenae]QLF71734.1 iron ABC transporter permease [Peteryoungia desertarenae]